MKNYIYLLLIISNFSFSQEINGVYKSNLTLFRSTQNPEKNFTNNSTEFYITVDVYDAPYARGTISIMNKAANGENVTLKFIIKGDKKYTYENNETFLTYEAVISMLNIETDRKCKIAFDVKVKSFIVVFEGGATQLWDLKKL